jgi:hypothetical protein
MLAFRTKVPILHRPGHGTLQCPMTIRLGHPSSFVRHLDHSPSEGSCCGFVLFRTTSGGAGCIPPRGRNPVTSHGWFGDCLDGPSCLPIALCGPLWFSVPPVVEQNCKNIQRLNPGRCSGMLPVAPPFFTRSAQRTQRATEEIMVQILVFTERGDDR